MESSWANEIRDLCEAALAGLIGGSARERRTMKKPAKATIAVILLAAHMARAQTKTPTTKPKPEKPLSISPYMRKVGLLYLEQLHDSSTACWRGEQACIDEQVNFRKTVTSIEDRISIDIDEKGRPAGDHPYFDLLKEAGRVEETFLLTLRTRWSLSEAKLARMQSDALQQQLRQEGLTPSPEVGETVAQLDDDIQANYEDIKQDAEVVNNCSSIAHTAAEDGNLFPSLAASCGQKRRERTKMVLDALCVAGKLPSTLDVLQRNEQALSGIWEAGNRSFSEMGRQLRHGGAIASPNRSMQ